ncbi:MAG: hypothetical protein V2I33_21470 [Kangiellaceae bacterium]|jgi:hypothetical protein|nr:hypothetical protein [Kangiellaceae bacterium]
MGSFEAHYEMATNIHRSLVTELSPMLMVVVVSPLFFRWTIPVNSPEDESYLRDSFGVDLLSLIIASKSLPVIELESDGLYHPVIVKSAPFGRFAS